MLTKVKPWLLRILSKSGLQIQTLSAWYPTVQHHIPHLLKTLANLKPLLFRPNGDRNHRSKHRMMVMILVGAEHDLTTDKGHIGARDWANMARSTWAIVRRDWTKKSSHPKDRCGGTRGHPHTTHSGLRDTFLLLPQEQWSLRRPMSSCHAQTLGSRQSQTHSSRRCDTHP